MKGIDVHELKLKLDRGDDVELLDCREDNERALCHIGGTHIPMNQIPERIAEIPRDKELIVYCRSGQRSANVIRFLEQRGFSRLTNLDGGILAWSREIDDSIPQY